MDASDLKERAEECQKRGWIKVWFAIEVMAVEKDLAEASLKRHIEGMEKVKDMLIFEKKFSETHKVEKPMRDIKEAYSQVVETVVYIKDFAALINIVVAFGPSSIEILEPMEYKLKVDEMQSLVNTIAGIMHQFASAGIGGMIIPTLKKSNAIGADAIGRIEGVQ